tara:strand:- start:10261 stop:10833 length:573 start_codon:yes stop_codon:yes gene_type:complete
MDAAESKSEEPPLVKGANFWIRLIAHSIDLAIVMMVACAALVPLSMRVLNQGGTGDLSIPWWIEIPIDLALIALVVAMWHHWQTTPGKRIFELKIVDSKTGGRPSWGRLIVRYLGYVVAMLPIIPFKLIWPGMESQLLIGTMPEGIMAWFIGLPLGIGFLWILIDPRNRGWHDLMSRTVTISTKFREPEA